MANEEHLKILKQGVEAWNKWREENPKVIPDLANANLSNADLSDAILADADLSNANLTEADLTEADLTEADLSNADLTDANLTGAHLFDTDLFRANLVRANLSDADLLGANLSGADLTDANLIRVGLTAANLTGANLSGADLSEARVATTIFGGVNLSVVKGLEAVTHMAPSPIDIDTIYRSGGKIPESFLEGAGVPENFITYMRSLVVDPFDFYSCFISYSSKDEKFARRLHADLRERKVRVWYAPEDLAGGKKLHEQIDQAIRVYDKLLLVLSENSMNSEWVATEIYKARKRELKEKRRILFPIRLVSFETITEWEQFDGDTGKDLAREVREYFIPDFQEWKDHEKYEEAFERLLKDLKAGGVRTAKEQLQSLSFQV